jgi:hypothetical protein
MERLLKRICHVRPEFHNSKEWFLLHENTPANTASVGRFLARKQVTVLHHPSYSSDSAPADLYLFPNWNYNWKGSFFRTFPKYKQILVCRANHEHSVRHVYEKLPIIVRAL